MKCFVRRKMSTLYKVFVVKALEIIFKLLVIQQSHILLVNANPLYLKTRQIWRFDSCDGLSNLTQIGLTSSIFRRVWPSNLMNDLTKQQGTCTILREALRIISNHQWIQTGATVRKRSIRVKISGIVCPVWTYNLTDGLEQVDLGIFWLQQTSAAKGQSERYVATERINENGAQHLRSNKQEDTGRTQQKLQMTRVTLTYDILSWKGCPTHYDLMGCVCFSYEVNRWNRDGATERTR